MNIGYMILLVVYSIAGGVGSMNYLYIGSIRGASGAQIYAPNPRRAYVGQPAT